ncbi:MAG TPA: UvrD-helicase domain-containing protein [Alphaproteobacteria bacterium]|nr:UvrD-helicase domain-containing protein [Alphaproteobacteria bacterium]
MPLNWNPAQQAVLNASGSRAILGPPGSGKTVVLLELAQRAAQAGKRVFLVTFAYRTVAHLRAQGALHTPGLPSASIQPLVELAAAQLKAAGQNLTMASNNEVRRILRNVLIQQGFNGSIAEAEHIVRAAKANAKKLPESDRFFPLVQAYQNKLTELNLLDRHDIVRAHVRGMRDETVAPIPADLLLVDGVQDATELQLIWLKDTFEAGVDIVVAANDDLTTFGRDGATGPQALETLKGFDENFPAYTLLTHYRTPAALAPGIAKIARFLRQRNGIDEGKPENTAPAMLTVKNFETPAEEHAFLTRTAAELAASGKQVGIITRDDITAATVTHLLQKNGLNPASYARLIWEEPGAQLMLSLLYVLLDKASGPQLHQVMRGFGLPDDVITGWLAAGLVPNGWLARGGPMPPVIDAAPPTVQTALRLRRLLTTSWQGMAGKLLDPRDAFKACVSELLPNLRDEDKNIGLLAADMLLNLQGKLSDVLPRVQHETMPNPASPVVVAPVREVRNMGFSTVIIPYASSSNWPRAAYPLIGPDPEHERRLFYSAITRSAGNILITYTGALSPLATELQTTLRPRR